MRRPPRWEREGDRLYAVVRPAGATEAAEDGDNEGTAAALAALAALAAAPLTTAGDVHRALAPCALLPEELVHVYRMVLEEEEEEAEGGGGATERNAERRATVVLAALKDYMALLGGTSLGSRSPGEALPAEDNSIS